MSDEPNNLPTNQNSSTFRKVPPNNGINWLTEAFDLFKQSPLSWFSSVLLMIFLLLFMMIIPLINFFTVVATPIFSAGFMVICLTLRQNKPFKVSLLFQGFSQGFNSLLVIGLISLAYTLICSYFAFEFASILGRPVMQVTPEMLTSGKLDIEAFMQSLLLPILILMALMLPMFMATWFSPALVILRNVKATVAMKQSLKACQTNLKAFTIYGLVALVAVITVMIVSTLISILIPAFAILINLLSNLFFTSVVMASMFTSFEDVFFEKTLFENNTDNKNTNNHTDENNEDGPTSIIV